MPRMAKRAQGLVAVFSKSLRGLSFPSTEARLPRPMLKARAVLFFSLPIPLPLPALTLGDPCPLPCGVQPKGLRAGAGGGRGCSRTILAPGRIGLLEAVWI